MILGRPWERLVRAKHDNRNNGSCYTTIHDELGNAVTICLVLAHHERNRREARSTKVHRKLEGKAKGKGNIHHPRDLLGGGNYASDACEEVHAVEEGEVFTQKSFPKENDVRMIEGEINCVDFPSKSYATDGSWKNTPDALTLYKRKKDKIRPANQPHTRGLKRKGSEHWKEKLIGFLSPINRKYP